MSERPRLTDSEITDLLRWRSARPAPDELAATVLESLATERALHPIRTKRRSARRPLVPLAAAAALLLFGGALAAGSGLLRRPAVVPPVIAPSLLAITSPDATPTHRPTPSATEPSSPTPLSLKLAWTQVALDPTFSDGKHHTPRVAWVGDRFVLADMESGAVRTSTDGTSWEALQPSDAAPGYVHLLGGARSIANSQDTIVGFWHPQDGPDVANTPPTTARDIVTIVHPPAAPISTTPFGGWIESIGVGPKGIVAEVHSVLDLQAITDTAQDGGFGWYSPTGEHWTQMARRHTSSDLFGARLPTGAFGEVVGVPDGFIASGDGGMWYSANGLAWRFLGKDSGGGRLLPWTGGALEWNAPGVSGVWTSAGFSKLPVPADVNGMVRTGPLGIVAVAYQDFAAGAFHDGVTYVSRNGIDYGSSPIPAEMAHGNLGGTHYPPLVAVGDRTVLVLELYNDEVTPITWSLWLGTLEP